MKRWHIEYISDRTSLAPLIAFAGNIEGVAAKVLLEKSAAGLNAFMVLDGICDSLCELYIDRLWSQLLYGISGSGKQAFLPEQAHIRWPKDGAPENVRKPVA